MRIEEAVALRTALNVQALSNCSFAADGKTPLTFKVTDTRKGNRTIKDGYSVKAVELVEKTNLQSGNKFWIDRETPPFLDPSCDGYYD